MTRRASPDELAPLAEGVLPHRKGARVGANTAGCTRLTPPVGSAEGRKRPIHAQAGSTAGTSTTSPSAVSCPSSTNQRNAPAQEKDPSDVELLRRHVAGDRDAFGQLFRRHREQLWAVAVRTLGDKEEAADAVQDAMIAAFQGADSFRGHSAVTTWLYRIVVNAGLDRMRRHAARPTTSCQDEDTLDALNAGRRSLADPAERSDTAIEVRAALRQLVPEQQAALVLVDMLGYSVLDAAHLLGVSEGTVKSRAARGRARLLPRLEHLHARSAA
jgi:RNA polymerase sigma-70 factor, ECF subfamily